MITLETVVLMPLLIWVFLALFVYWDAYRSQNSAVKATVVIADMITRENAPIGNGYIDGMHRIFRYATAAQEASTLRVTLLQYDGAQLRYNPLWSRSSDDARAPPHDSDTVTGIRDRLPTVADADTLMVVETWLDFTPAFPVGLGARRFYEVVPELMRFQALLPIG